MVEKLQHFYNLPEDYVDFDDEYEGAMELVQEIAANLFDK